MTEGGWKGYLSPLKPQDRDRIIRDREPVFVIGGYLDLVLTSNLNWHENFLPNFRIFGAIGMLRAVCYLGFMYAYLMPWTPPINARLRKDLLKDKRFYRLLSEHANFIDPDTTFAFYMSLVALVGEELRRNKIVRLPHLGDFALIRQQPRVAWTGSIQAKIDSREVLRFYPKERLRRYFSQRQGPIRYLELLPPPAIR